MGSDVAFKVCTILKFEGTVWTLKFPTNKNKSMNFQNQQSET